MRLLMLWTWELERVMFYQGESYDGSSLADLKWREVGDGDLSGSFIDRHCMSGSF